MLKFISRRKVRQEPGYKSQGRVIKWWLNQTVATCSKTEWKGCVPAAPRKRVCQH